MRRYQFGLRVTTWILIAGLVCLICALCVLCSPPPISRDALTQHLAIPKLYINHGGIYEIPFMVFSYYPMNLDLLYMIPLYFGNDVIPKFIHFSFALLTALLMFFYLRHRTNHIYALFGIFFFLSLPIIIKLSITVYVDLGLVFFSTASLLLIIRWLDTGFPIRLLILSAICCGLAMGTKYNGTIVFLILSLFVPFLHAKYGPTDKVSVLNTLGQGMIFALVAILFFSPWMIRNYLWTQNPLYPFYNQWFNNQTAFSHYPGVLVYRSLAYHEQWWEIALLPIRVFFQGQDNNPQYFDGRLNPLLLFLPFFAFYPAGTHKLPHRREKMILLVFAALYFAFAFFTANMRIRYILPIIPPLILLSVVGLRNLLSGFSGIVEFWMRWGMRIGTFGIVSICLLLNLQYVITQFRIIEPFSYLEGSIDRAEYISKHIPEYPVVQYINKNLPSDSLLLFLFMGQRGYYYDREYILDMKRNESLLQETAEKAIKVEDILRRFLDLKITHIVMHERLFVQWVNTSFSPNARMLMHQFMNRNLYMLYSRNGYRLYVVKQ